MEKDLSKAFTEVYEILKVTPIELTSKIPTKFRKIIEENRDTEYRFQLEEPFNEKDLNEESVIILGLICRDFFADPEEREELRLKDTEAIKRVEEEMNQKYDMENVFNNKRAKKSVNTPQEEMGLTVYKEGFIKKIFNLIKGIFKK